MHRTARRIYRSFLALYPADFRDEYGDDMVLLYDDLIAEHGALPATRRAAIDLIVTLPRYRLESAMTDSRITQVLTWGLSLLVLAGISAPLYGVLWLAPIALGLAVIVGAANHHRLATAIRQPSSATRTSRFRVAAICAVLAVGAIGAWMAVLANGEVSTLGLVLPSLVGTAAMIGALGFLAAGLLTPRHPVA